MWALHDDFCLAEYINNRFVLVGILVRKAG